MIAPPIAEPAAQTTAAPAIAQPAAARAYAADVIAPGGKVDSAADRDRRAAHRGHGPAAIGERA